MKKMLMFGLAMMLLMVPGAAFADELPEDWKDIRLEEVAEYTPENYDEWVRLFDAKESLSIEREALKVTLSELIENIWQPYIDEMKGEAKTLMEAYREVLKSQVAEEVITVEEAKVLFEEYKLVVYADLMLMKEEHEADKAEREEEHAYYEGLRVERKGYNEQIKMALELESYELIPNYLNSILIINQALENHAIEVNEEIQEKIDDLNSL